MLHTHTIDERVEFALISEGILTKEQLSRAKNISEHLGGEKTLKEVLIDMNWVNPQKLDDFVRRQKMKQRVGEILVARNLVTEEEVQKALEAQRKATPRAKRIGEILVEMGVIEERHVIEALCEKFSLKMLEPDITEIDLELVRKVSLKYLRRQIALPVKIENSQLLLLVADPTNTAFIEEIARLFMCRVKLAMATSAAITQTFDIVDAMLQGKDSGYADYQKVKYHSLETPAPQTTTQAEDRVVQMVDQLIRTAIDEGASDVHLEPMANKLRMRYRLDGVLVHKLDFPRDYTPRIISRIKLLAEADIAERRKHQDGRIFIKTDKTEIDIRASFYATVFGENVVLRILNKASLISIKDLGFAPNTLKKFTEDVLDIPSGITLITGPTGSGKTTTLYSSVDYCNDPTVKIITCEDPVEYVIDGISQCSINEKIGLTFHETLRSIVRQDPDIIVIGEIRDRFSADVAVQSALTGHKVFATFHTEDSVGALVRLINMEIETSLIASTISSILAQRLVRKVCPNCQVEYQPEERLLKRFGLTKTDLLNFKLVHGKGCSTCNFTGYKGRVGIYELLVPNAEVRDAILQKQTAQQIRQISLDSCDLVTMQEDGMIKALKGLTTLEEVLENAPRVFHHRSYKTVFEIMGY
ncbi:MAG: ATPase, T2SS/T4P/T4SS family [Acidobacteriota bacterium]